MCPKEPPAAPAVGRGFECGAHPVVPASQPEEEGTEAWRRGGGPLAPSRPSIPAGAATARSGAYLARPAPPDAPGASATRRPGSQRGPRPPGRGTGCPRAPWPPGTAQAQQPCGSQARQSPPREEAEHRGGPGSGARPACRKAPAAGPTTGSPASSTARALRPCLPSSLPTLGRSHSRTAQLSCPYAERPRLASALTPARPQPHPPGGGATLQPPQHSLGRPTPAPLPAPTSMPQDRP